MCKIAIKEHKTRGTEVIELLEMLGGKNTAGLKNTFIGFYYWINEDNEITVSDMPPSNSTVYSLEDFKKEYPYKVGDLVRYYPHKVSVIKSMFISYDGDIKYGLEDVDDIFFQAHQLEYVGQAEYYQMNENVKSSKDVNLQQLEKQLDEALEKETKESLEKFFFGESEPEPKAPILSNRYDYADGKCGYVIPDGYEFDCIKNGFQNEIILKSKNPKHPTTSVESCEVLGYTVDDVIFTNDTGWIRITNKLWDCYANEHVYEGIGIINEHEYKDIRHHNVTGKMQLGRLKHCKDVDDVRYVNSITDDIMINQITNKVSVIKFKPDVCDNKIELLLGDYEIEVIDGRTFAVNKKPKYPKTYKDCRDVLGYKNRNNTIQNFLNSCDLYDSELMTRLSMLKLCRDAYWKIAGEELGLGKPWKPDFLNPTKEIRYFIFYTGITIEKGQSLFLSNTVLIFPTEEMRDVFYENFKELIEQCKELL